MTNSSATPHFDLTPPSDAQLRKLIDGLSAEERRVMLHHGDEEPFCGVLLAEKREGVFTCRLCGLPQAAHENFASWTMAIAEHPAELEVVLKGFGDLEALSTVDRAVFN